MIIFRNMGSLQYMIKYKINRDTKTIKSFLAIIDSIDDMFTKVAISTIINKSSKLGTMYTNYVQMTDKAGKIHQFNFDSCYVMRLDHYIDYIKRWYRTKVENKVEKLDYTQYHYYNSTLKTENEFQVPIGVIATNNGDEEKGTIYITVDKNNGAIKCGNDITIKAVTVEDDAVRFDNIPVEIFSVGKSGIVHFIDREIYHDYYDKDGIHHNVSFSGYDIPKQDTLINLPTFYQIHRIVNIGDPIEETINIDYDCYGIYKSNDSEKYPVIYRNFNDSNNPSLPEIVYSLHPVHIDHNDMNLTQSDGLYALDHLDTCFEADDSQYVFTREVRKIDESHINYIKSEIEQSPDSIMGGLCLASIDSLVYDILYQ